MAGKPINCGVSEAQTTRGRQHVEKLQKHEKKLDKGGGGGYNNRALESPAQLRPEAQIFFPKVEKVLDLWRKLCYINQAVGDDGVKDREAECTL